MKRNKSNFHVFISCPVLSRIRNKSSKKCFQKINQQQISKVNGLARLKKSKFEIFIAKKRIFGN